MKVICFLIISVLLVPMTWAQDAAGPLHLSLDEALAKAQNISTQVLVSQARVESALARIDLTRSSLMPHVSGLVTGARQTKDMRNSGIQFPGAGPEIGPYNSFDGRARIIQTIFDPSVLDRLKAARFGKKLSDLQLSQARQDALALVAAMYIQAQRAQQHVRMTQAFLKRDKKALDLAKTAYAEGTGSLLELKKAKADYVKGYYIYRQAKSDAVEKKMDIASALKLPLNQPIIFTEKTYEPFLQKALSGPQVSSIDLQVAQEQLNVVNAEVKAAKSDYWPKLSAFGDWGRAGESPKNGSNTYTIGLQATIPFWEGGSKQAALKEAEANARQGQALLDDTQIQNKARILQYQENVKEAQSFMMATSYELSTVNQAYRIAKDRLNQGAGHQLDVDIAYAQRALAIDQYREAVAMLWLSKINLAHDRGQMEELIRR